MPEFATTTLAQALRATASAGSLRPGGAGDAVCGVVPELYFEPADEAELAMVLGYAHRAGMQVAPRGSGSKLEWGAAPQSVELMLSTARLNRILEHAPGDMTITVGGGVTTGQMQTALAAHGQRLALDPLWPARATVGGVVASNDSGALRVRYGGVRDLIIGSTVVLADGTIASSGGKVVKNVAGYDLSKLMTGALGTLGIITRAVFRLHPLPESSETLSFAFGDRERANQFMLAIADSIAVPTGLQMRTDATGGIGVDVRLEGIAAGVAAQASLVRGLAGGAKGAAPAGDPWQAREELWNCGGGAVICKLSMLPSQLSSTAEFIREALSVNAEWRLVMHSTGLGWLRAEAADCAQLAAFIAKLRTCLAPQGGSAVVLKAPAALRQAVAVWGEVGNALPLMKRVKGQFDPHAVLNRGRFVGGI